MSANIEYLYDKDGNIILPKTVTKAITDENGNRLDKVLGQPNMDMVMLGWSVPIDCPIKNYVDDNRVFHQLVGRVDLGSLDWTYHSNEGAFNSTFIEAKNKGITYCYKYVNVPNYAMFRITDNCVLIEYIWSPGINIKTNEYTDSTTFKNAMKGVFLYYELDKEITFPVDGHEQYNRTNDLKMLGWTVPIECPIQNYTDSNGIYHQRVGRVDLSQLALSYDSTARRFSANVAGVKKSTRLTPLYIKGYASKYNGEPFDANWDKTTYIGNIAVYIHDHDYTDVTAFKNAMLQQNAYVYYELATEITIPIDGNEATTNQMLSDEWLSGKAYAQGDFAIYKNKLWKSKVANNVGNIPAEGTYWEATNVVNNLFRGIDTTKVVRQESNTPFTATEDCFMVGRVSSTKSGYLGEIFIDNAVVLTVGTTTTCPYTLPIKKGQTVSFGANTTVNIRCYGIK